MVDYKWGFINKKGHFVIKPQFDSVESFINGWTPVLNFNSEEYNCSFIDKTGKIVFNPNKLGYTNRILEDTCLQFAEGLLFVYSFQGESYGYIDKTGKIFIKNDIKQPLTDDYRM